jgi:hypothetical protein
MTCLLKVEMAEPKETSIASLQQPKQLAIAKQWLRKHVPVAREADATVEELLENRLNNKKTMETVFLALRA